MRYDNDDFCSSKDPFFDICLDFTKDKLMSKEDFDKYYRYFKGSNSFKEEVKKLQGELEKRKNEFTLFEQFLLMRLMSINMATDLYNKRKFKINFTDKNLYEGSSDWYYDPDKTYKDKLINLFGRIDINCYWSINSITIYYQIPEGLINREFHDDYYKDNRNRYYITTLYGLYQVIKKNSNIRIIDHGKYIMFYQESPDGKVKLIRTPDNDIEWTEDLFMEAFLMMYNIYLNE